MRGVWMVCLAGWLGLSACGDDEVGEGEACDAAQDCAGSLVCAKVTADGDDKVCADIDDTHEDNDCEPEYADMACWLVLNADAGL